MMPAASFGHENTHHNKSPRKAGHASVALTVACVIFKYLFPSEKCQTSEKLAPMHLLIVMSIKAETHTQVVHMQKHNSS